MSQAKSHFVVDERQVVEDSLGYAFTAGLVYGTERKSHVTHLPVRMKK